jgi:hypothetical protein
MESERRSERFNLPRCRRCRECARRPSAAIRHGDIRNSGAAGRNHSVTRCAYGDPRPNPRMQHGHSYVLIRQYGYFTIGDTQWHANPFQIQSTISRLRAYSSRLSTTRLVPSASDSRHYSAGSVCRRAATGKRPCKRTLATIQLHEQFSHRRHHQGRG